MHQQPDKTIDVSKFTSTFDRNEITSCNNAIIVRKWVGDLNTKIDVVIGCIVLYSICKLGYTLYKYKKEQSKNCDEL